jgi:heavy metal sensor kinase
LSFALSVRARLTLWHAGVLATMVTLLSAAIFLIAETMLYRDLDQMLARDLTSIRNAAQVDERELAELESQVGIALFAVIEDGRVRYRSNGWQDSGIAAAFSDGRMPGPRSWISPDGRSYRVSEVSDASFHASMALDEGPVRQTLDTLATALLIVVPCGIGVAIAGGYFLAGRVLQPIGAMADKARKISAESLGERLSEGSSADEFGRLAAVLDDALARVQASFEQLRRFTADASHELRTPLTAMRSVGEVALQKSLEPAAYRDVIGSMLEEVERLTRLVESLLALTRAESGAVQVNAIPVELGTIAAGVSDQLRVLAEEKGQALRVEAEHPVLAVCDPAILKQGLMNLLHNAIKYTPDFGSILVKVETISATEASIEVRDTGPGIPAAAQERIFDRFYRVDEGRSRESGGVGLGLAIALWAMQANGGRIELESTEGQGSLFRIVLPAGAG